MLVVMDMEWCMDFCMEWGMECGGMDGCFGWSGARSMECDLERGGMDWSRLTNP